MTTKLPAINRRSSLGDMRRPLGESKMNIENFERPAYVSPFRLPTDDEVFVYREVERKKREDLKTVAEDLKIWDKQTGTSRRPLRLFNKFDGGASKENIQVKNYAEYNPKDKDAIIEAQRIINERRKSRETTGKDHKEGVVELLEQKKEMFLVERTVGIIEKERETLIQKANEKEDALKKSDEMLEHDWKEFEAYKQNNKQETDQAIMKYNQEVEARKRTETEYKIKNNELTSLKAEKTKNEEFIQKYLDAKNFLDKLTPKEFLEHRSRELREKVEDIRHYWMEREASNREETQSVLAESITKGFTNRERKHPVKKHTKTDIEKVFQDKVDRGEFDDIEEFKLSQKMYFNDPEQLVEVFTRLEEGNLALIQMMQDAEQNLENLKNSLKQKRIEFDKKIGGLRDNKMLLDKSKHEKEIRIKHLDAKAKEPRLAKTDGGLIPLRKRIIEVVNIFKDELKGTVDLDTMSALDLLAILELHLEKQLEKLNDYKPTKVAELKRSLEEKRKRANRKLQAEREQRLAEERSRKASERILEKTKKRNGRLDMTKSVPLERKAVVTQVVTTNADEEDMKYFKPYLSKF